MRGTLAASAPLGEDPVTSRVAALMGACGIACGLVVGAPVGMATPLEAQRTGAAHIPAPPFAPNWNDVVRLSPIGRYDAGERRFGAYSLNDPQMCSLWAVRQFFAVQDPPLAARFLGDADLVWDARNPAGDRGEARFQIRNWVNTINAVLNQLRTNGDVAVSGRYFCVGLAKYAAPNALSIGLGFIVFDPQVFIDVNYNPNRSGMSMDAIAMHEVAHQLQYWTNERVLGDRLPDGRPYARRTELQADCTSAALIAAQWLPKVGVDLWRRLDRDGVMAAVRAVGDFEILDQSHHGTPHEREVAAELGALYSEDYVQRNAGQAPRFLSVPVLNGCRASIEAMDRKWGNPWPPQAKAR
jgi:hypothetical protein